MKKYFDRLSSMERRFVLGVLVVIFLVINVLFVWPRFKDWDDAKVRLAKAEKTKKLFDAEISQTKNYETKVRALESEGAAVPPEDQETEFLRSIQTQASLSGVNIIGNARQNAPTNQFFLERAQAITVEATEPQLVDFLYSLGAGNSLIRVRDLSLRPDGPRQKLSASIKLVASYQKKSAARAVAAAATNSVATPVATSTKK